jgi:antitoxin (DNA-binding transcriptional repressor) of toxin-antitoxin stability system
VEEVVLGAPLVGMSMDTWIGNQNRQHHRFARPAARSCYGLSIAKLAYLAHTAVMSSETETELSVSEARDHFSDAVNRAAFGGEITYVTRGRSQQRAAAIVPADLVDRYEAMIDSEDGRVAMERLADLDTGRTNRVTADEVARTLGL